ncbi:MAG: lipid ABC transporter permease [Gammaproteobacteria bacterium]|uniref:Tetraacyldisaccharide 4'-kinase n=1 Tax=OM182 bacterium TaxID=2510334 RepID=A0A520S093_9GAMM|nr:lipid ABC transporter permease [Gammaproteobacteria bacterium]RZO75890.1 MAG: lipid A export permease/ATP-binding protein MsbA [OM182 bacterium]
MSLPKKYEVSTNLPDISNTGIYRRLLAYVIPYWIPFLVSIVGYLIYSASNVAFVQLISYIVDSLQGNDPLLQSQYANIFSGISVPEERLNRTVIPLAIIGLVFLRGVGTFIGDTFIAHVATNLVHNLRRKLFNQMMHLPISFFDSSQQGHLVAKVTFHVTQVTGAATDAVKIIIREGFTVIGYLAFLLYLNWKLTLILLAVAPMIAILVKFAGVRFRRISEKIQQSMGDVTHVVSEAVQGLRIVRIFGGSEYEKKRFEKASNNYRRQALKMVITASIATPTTQLLVGLALAVLVWLVLDPELLASMTPGNVVAFITTGGLLAKPIRQLAEVNATVQKGLAAAEDIFDLFDQEIEKDEGEEILEVVKGDVEFRDVSFSYGEGLPNVLRGLSFHASPGETIALVGKSGSGKSTLASLIPRFYSPTNGSILIDGKPIHSLSLTNLRQHIALVTQDITLFNNTIAENIAYGRLSQCATNDVIEAAKKAHIWDFISSLDQGLSTIIGDDGVLLSGGQRQRLAIARAFLKDAPILILDEATSALDSESERYIQSALEEVVKGRTTFIIAHRLSTVEKANRILVIDEGQVIEQGTHAELLDQNGHYAHLHTHGSENKKYRDAEERKPIVMSGSNRSEELGWEFNPLVKAWYSDASWIYLLAPLGWVYEQLAKLRRKWLEGQQMPAKIPVIIVGNINIGGTGKSPLVIWIIEQLLERGFRPGIVSRGYGGRAKQYPMEVSKSTDPHLSGDEPAMLARRLGVPIVVDPNRVQAVEFIANNYNCDVVVSDDGLQHYRLYRNIEIAVIDGQRGLGNGLCLPAGPLRESPERLKEVDFIVTNGEPSQKLVFESTVMRIESTNLVNMSTGAKILPTELSFVRIHAVAGIANPVRFFNMLRELGFEVIEHRFADHYSFKLADLDYQDQLPVVMTEKDAVKCERLNLDRTSHWYLEISAKLPDTFSELMLNKFIR